MDKLVTTATVQVAQLSKKKKVKPNLNLSFESLEPQLVSYGVVSKTARVGNGRMQVSSLTIKLNSLGLKIESKNDLLMLEFKSKSYHWSMKLKKKQLHSLKINGEEQWNPLLKSPLSGSQLEKTLKEQKKKLKERKTKK
ncbi:MAG: hypothetical protein Q4B28_03130 [bacterium]|nr:hypothetical protein [bacterium]